MLKKNRKIAREKSVNRAKRFFLNEYIFAIISKIVLLAFSFAHSILLANYLGAKGQGDYSYTLSIATVASIILTFGVHQAYPVMRKKYGKDNVLNEYMTMMLMIFISLEIVALTLFFVCDFSFLIRTAILIAPLFAYSRISSYVYLIEKPNKNNLWTVLIMLTDILALTMFYLFVKTNNYIFVFILAFVDAQKSLAFTILIRFKFSLSNKSGSLLLEIMKIGFFPMIALLLTTLNYKIDIIMLKNSPYVTAAAVGVYSVGISLSEKTILIPDTLKSILISHLAKGSDEVEVCKITRISFLGSVILSGVAIGLCYLLVPYLYGSEFIGASEIVAVCAVGVCFVGFFKLIAQYFIIKNKQWINALLLLIAVGINILLNLLFVKYYGIVGAAISTSISHFICGVLFIVFFWRISKVRFLDILIIKKSDFAFISSLFKKEGAVNE